MSDIRNPYPGLRAFEQEESALFFGREREIQELRQRLRTARFLAVIGRSGSGKSSLVRSGLVPALRRAARSAPESGWRIALTRPGEDPIGRLAQALDQAGLLAADEARLDVRRTLLDVLLRDSSLGLAEIVRQSRLPAAERLLVIVDQFEELFRYREGLAPGAASDAAIAFVRLLLEATWQQQHRIFVVVTMRSEFIGECAAFEQLPEAINAGQYLIPRMSRDALRAAITGPALAHDVAMASRLVTRLLNEVGEDVDRLPVLQHALRCTWQAWAEDHLPGEAIDNRHYDAAGTMRDALSRHAEEAYKELAGPAQRALAERVFKSLTAVTEGGHRVRRPTRVQRLAEICGMGIEALSQLIAPFRQEGRTFLLPPPGSALQPDDIVDISHESLMHMWTRLGIWVGDEARSVEIYRRLSRSAAQHAAGESSLWRPPELSIGLRWRQENRPNAAWAGDGEAFAQAIRFLQRSRRVHLLKRRTVFATVALTAALVIGMLYRSAETQRQLAESRRREAETQRGLAEAARTKADRLEAELQRLKPSTVKSALVRWITVATPEVRPREILEVKIATQSSQVRISGIFVGTAGPQRVEGLYAPDSGGIYLSYPIPADTRAGPKSASIYVQEIGSSREEILTISYIVLPGGR